MSTSSSYHSKETPDSVIAYQRLKAITDAVYSGSKTDYGKDVLALLKSFNISPRQDDGQLKAVNISIPSSISDSIVVGLRYVKKDGTDTEDHFLFRKGENLRAFYKDGFEKYAREYAGAHKEQTKERSEPVTPEYAAWIYLNLDLAKISYALDCYDQIFEIVNVRDDAYNLALQILLDSLSSSIVVGLARYFEKRKDSWGLDKLGVSTKEVCELKEKYDELMELRHSQLSHLKKGKESKYQFFFLSDRGTELARELVQEVHKMLSEIGRTEYSGQSYALTWAGADTSLELLIERLKG
ncbi:MAG: hypothetical protein U0516_03865 [Candidatus Saccharibacteria bacterium]